MEHFYFRGVFLRPPLQAMLIGRAHEGLEQRMRLQRLRLELGMELAADEVRVIRQFHHLHVSSVRSGARNSQSRRDQRLFVLAVELITMAMAFADFELAVDLM